MKMKVAVLGLSCAVACCTASAQNSIPVFSATNVRASQSGAGYGANLVTFNSSTLSLSCPGGVAPSAIVSSTADGTGYVLVDNFLNLTVTQGETTTGPVNICRGGQVDNGNLSDCFTAAYQGPASGGQLTGLDPDTFASSGGGVLTSAGGVPPIDISASLASGLNTVKLDLLDAGGFLASSSIYLYTSCSQGGVSGPAQITGNPISGSNPTPQQLTQNFAFNSSGNQLVRQVVDLSTSEQDGNLTIADGTIPNVDDQPIDPAMWLSSYVPGTSFATSACLIHNGELLNGQPACKLYTVTCQVGQGATATGAQCPRSTIRDEVFADNFDGPSFTLPTIRSGDDDYGDFDGDEDGPVFHQGIGYLMASEGWLGGPCMFDVASGLQDQLCPANILTDFSGPGAYTSTGTTKHPNSAFIAVAPVPEDHTHVRFNFCPTGKWINSHTVKAHFASRPPVVPQPNNGFVAAPIQTITYGVSLETALPSTEFPIPTDTVLTNPVACPVPGGSPVLATRYDAGEQTITVPADGKYLVHYFATDCAGTQELRFTQDNTGSWSTSFYTKKLYVDTVPPQVVSGPVLSPPPAYHHGVLGYTVGQQVTATFQCSDDFSGVQRCGRTFYNEWKTNPAPATNQVDTSSPGTRNFTVYAWDFAGNQSAKASISYTVVPQ